jgi:DNA polymerase (family 10)
VATKKSYSNQEIAQILQNIATSYEIKKKNFFRIKSYQDAAETILTYPKPVYQLWQKDPQLFDNIPGIGPNIFSKITYLFKTDKLHPHIIRAFKGIHPTVFTFTKVNSIGPKTAYTLTKKLKFSKNSLKALDQLIKYCQQGKIRNWPHFGIKSEASILENTLAYLGQNRRMTYIEAKKNSDKIIKYLKKFFSRVEIYALGSLRRHSQTVGDIDLAVKSEKSEKILDKFIEYSENIQTIDRGPKKASIRIYPDIRVDIMIQPAKNFASLLQHFTGSRQHNILLRKHALLLGYSVSEYGIKNLKTGKINTFENEEKLYNFLKLCYIKPQDRIGEHEIETAQKCYNKSQVNH